MSSRDRSLIALVLLVIIAVGGYFVVVQPAHRQADKLDKQITEQQTSLAQAEQQVQAGLVAERESKAYTKQLKAIATAVPSDEQIPTLINELQSAATKDKVFFGAIQPTSATGTSTPVASAASAASVSSAVATTSAFPSESFQLTFTGGYYAVTNLLGTLASFVHADNRHFKASGRLISISSVSYAGGTGNSGSVAKPGDVSASVAVADYDIPTALLSSGSATSPSP